MSKVVWVADSAMHFVSAKTDLPDDYQLKSNETFVEPINQDGSGMLAPATLLGQGQGWRPATAEEHKAYMAEQRKLHPDQYSESKPVGPSAEQQMINALGKTQMTQGTQIDANTADIKEVKQMINFIGKQQMAQGNK